MASKKLLWVVIACLAIVVIHQIVKLTAEISADSPSPEMEPATQPDQHTTQTASFGGLPSMPAEKTPQVIEPAKVEEQEQQSEPAEKDEAPIPEEQPKLTEEMAEEQNPPASETDQQVGWALAHRSEQDGGASPTLHTAAVAAPSNKGFVRGIVYSADSGSALIDETIVHTGGTIDGVRIVKVHAGGVDFEKDGRRWTQKVSEKPDPLWQ
ncbi:MAG: hypothetical protein JSW59_15760 [Phycisphaerales bacterium]|nr:MAG: hypothetical protein JSW59_15760 [Phycisphaerales bacterium]